MVKQATALVVTYPGVNAVSEDGNAAAVAWEKEFIRLVKVFDCSSKDFFLYTDQLYALELVSYNI